jgi:hypothetical protein
MKSQGAKLVAAIGAVVKSLDGIDTILDDLGALARRHHRYGVREEHYASVGAALLWALEQGLGFDFKPDVREAWTTAYDLLKGAMIAASSHKDPTTSAVGLRLACQHSAGPELSSERTHGARVSRPLLTATQANLQTLASVCPKNSLRGPT